MARNAQGKMLSSHSYITVRMRADGPTRKSFLSVADPHFCNHGDVADEDERGGTVCETAECLNSWSLDYMLDLRRTVRGRSIIEQFHLTDAQVSMLASSNFRDIHPSNDPFDKQYDKVSYLDGRKAPRA